MVPQFEAMFDSLNADLAWYTKTVLWLSSVLRGGWIVILAGVLLAGWWLNSRLRDPAGACDWTRGC